MAAWNTRAFECQVRSAPAPAPRLWEPPYTQHQKGHKTKPKTVNSLSLKLKVFKFSGWVPDKLFFKELRTDPGSTTNCLIVGTANLTKHKVSQNTSEVLVVVVVKWKS